MTRQKTHREASKMSARHRFGTGRFKWKSWRIVPGAQAHGKLGKAVAALLVPSARPTWRGRLENYQGQGLLAFASAASLAHVAAAARSFVRCTSTSARFTAVIKAFFTTAWAAGVLVPTMAE